MQLETLRQCKPPPSPILPFLHYRRSVT